MRNIRQVIVKAAFGVFLLLQVYTGFPLPHASLKSFEFFQHNVWTVDDGLPMNTVIAITQTPDGYIWAGTEVGLVRFDGIKFETFDHENAPFFTGNVVIALLKDRNGTLWIATRGDGLLRYRNGAFDAIKGGPGLMGNDIWALTESLDGSIWAGSAKGLFRLVDDTLSPVPLPGQLSTRIVSALLEDRHGQIWVGTNGAGLVLVKKRGDGFGSETLGPNDLKITTLFEDRMGVIWIGTMERGLFRYWNDKLVSLSAEHGLSNPQVRCFFEDRFGNIWIGTHGGGINILPVGGDRIHAFHRPEEFTSNIVLCFFQDREGTLWVGTNGGGLNSLRESRITTYSTKNGLSYNNLYGVFQDRSGCIWLGTKGYGVNYFKDNRFHSLTMADGLSSDSVVSIAQDLEGGMWFGTLGGWINRYKDGRFDIFDSRHGLSYNFFRALYVDPGGTLWAGTVNGGVHRYENGMFPLVVDVNTRVNTFLKDSGGKLWIGTFGRGLCRLDPENTGDGTFDVFDTDKGLSNNVVLCIHEDETGILWIGTFKGLTRSSGGSFAVMSKKDGLPDDVVYSILEDRKKDFWISSNRGIYCLSRGEVDAFFSGKTGTVTPTLYGKEAGMLSIECNGGNQPAGWKSSDGKLWFPTTNGLSVIDPMNIGLNNIPPPVVINSITIDGKSYPVPPAKPGNETVVVPPGAVHIEFHYSALSFIVPKKIRFKYRLEGYDRYWIDAGDYRKVFYSNLEPGRYRFRVTACNSDGVWNDTDAVVRLHLKTEFYRSRVFKIALVLVVVLVVLFIHIYLIWRRRSIPGKRHNGVPGNGKQKARVSSLNPEETGEYIRKLRYLLEVDNVYKDPDLTIKMLATKLAISPRYLSEIINDELKMNFYEFINEYRIKQAQLILKAPETRDRSVIDIASDVGYNSKSAFNRAFKLFSGVTPSEFRKKSGKTEKKGD